MGEKKQNIFFRLFKLIVWIAIIWGIIIYNKYQNFKSDILVKENKIIEIKSGETISDLATKLDINKNFLKYYLKNNNKNFKLLKWRFEIKENSKIDDIIEYMQKPLAEKEISLTFLEWWNIFDIDNYLTKKWLIQKGEYIKYVTNPTKIKKLTKFYKFLNPDFISLEWYLYPDTYKLKIPLKINSLVIKQLNNFENKVYNKIKIHAYHKQKNKNQKQINKSLYTIVKLASIVEKEEKNPKEKATVAGILKKRLNANWNIWADITVCYPHKLTSEECKMVVSKYIREKSEYNTRTMTWLPKTPIWNPSFETINATVYDKKTDFWYYLHNIKTWKIYYAKTNAQHEANKKYMY